MDSVLAERVYEMATCICDDLCRYPREIKEEKKLNKTCAKCPLNDYVYWLLNHTEPKEAEDAPSWKENFMQRFQKVV